ncbi:MAG: amidohydrolase family protein [Bacteroidales bacterium]|nr:amidohydrolase family protein [Bacteroidales bacterium]
MKVDRIIKNAKIFTSNKNNPQAIALVVKDGKFVYVGDEAGLKDYEGEVTDLGGKFIMPGIIDSHVHVTIPVAFDYADLGVRFEPDGKKGAMDFMAGYVKEHPGQKCYRFLLERRFLHGEEIAKEDLDAICPDSELILLEGECHSNWVNSKVLERMGITDDTPDPVPGLAYYVRKDGHVTGNSFETASWPILFDGVNDLTEEQIRASLERWIEFSKKVGVSAVFDAGFPEHNPVHERMYDILCKMDKEGKLPIYIDGSYVLTRPSKMHEAIEEVKRFNRKFNSEHLKVHTLKIFMDGTLKIETAAQVSPYVDTGVTGTTAFQPDQVAEILKALNEAGLDLHVHTVGAAASRVVLDGVELAQKELGDKYHVKVTCAHLEVQADEDLPRFAKLGVFANYTPWWHCGGGPGVLTPMLGEKRATTMYRCKTVWNTGATVAWSSDNVAGGDFLTWSPYLGMEIGMVRRISEKACVPDYFVCPELNPPAEERMNIEEMLIGYTINGAKQLGIEAHKGSIEAGKNADFLVFDNDLLTAEHEGFSHNKPAEVYMGGKKVN